MTDLPEKRHNGMMAKETREERIARWRSVAVSSEAMPTRKAGTKAEWDRMSRWEKEHDAARKLAAGGHEVPTLEQAPAKLKAVGG